MVSVALCNETGSGAFVTVEPSVRLTVSGPSIKASSLIVTLTVLGANSPSAKLTAKLVRAV